jgi:hypothetical protein
MIISLRFIKTSFLLLALLLAALPALSIAQNTEPRAALSDHSLLAGFPYSKIDSRKKQTDVNHRIVLGGLQRTRGEVVPANSEMLRGDVTKIIYEVSQEFSAADVYAFYQQQLASKNYQALYTCRGSACGSSNYWANDIFGNRILYGPERNQFYLAFRANTGSDADAFFSVYIITRANRTIYAYVEVIEPGGTLETGQFSAAEPLLPITEILVDEAESLILLQTLREQGSIVLSGIEFHADDRLSAAVDLSPILAALDADQSISIYLVGHLRQQGQTLALQVQRSTSRANALRQALIAAGIDGQRIEAAGVGPLAPSCVANNCAQRIEMVLR